MRCMLKLLAAAALTALLLQVCFTTAVDLARSRTKSSPEAKTNTVLMATLLGFSFELLLPRRRI